MNYSRRHTGYPVFFLLTFICCCLFSSADAASSVDDEVAKIQNAYETIRDISGNFIQKSHISDLKRTDSFKGLFYIKRPMKLKWNYSGEHAQDVVINNGEILIYQKKEKQAFRGKFDRKTYGQAPIALLNGFGNIREEFSVTEKNGTLILKPRKSMGNILSIEIVPSGDAFPIKSFTIIDALSNRIEMVLKDVRINTGLEDTLFEFSFPKGVNIFEHSP
ncbi:MAG: outer membrane lipoprotein carrier protein LolA [Nitrospirota bacterium]